MKIMTKNDIASLIFHLKKSGTEIGPDSQPICQYYVRKLCLWSEGRAICSRENQRFSCSQGSSFDMVQGSIKVSGVMSL